MAGDANERVAFGLGSGVRWLRHPRQWGISCQGGFQLQRVPQTQPRVPGGCAPPNTSCVRNGGALNGRAQKTQLNGVVWETASPTAAGIRRISAASLDEQLDAAQRPALRARVPRVRSGRPSCGNYVWLRSSRAPLSAVQYSGGWGQPACMQDSRHVLYVSAAQGPRVSVMMVNSVNGATVPFKRLP